MKTPDITKAQLLAILKFAVTEAIALGLLKKGIGQDIIAVGGIVLPATIAIADVFIRRGRAAIAATQANLTFVPGPNVHEAPKELAT